MTPRCPIHNRAMYVEDSDPFYGQAVWCCPLRNHVSDPDPGCLETVYTGPSDQEIYRREHWVSVPKQVRPVAEQLQGDWR